MVVRAGDDGLQVILGLAGPGDGSHIYIYIYIYTHIRTRVGLEL